MNYRLRIRDLREDHDLPQRVIAEYLHVTQRTYSCYERETIRIPLESLVKLAAYYHVSLDYLTGRTDKST